MSGAVQFGLLGLGAGGAYVRSGAVPFLVTLAALLLRPRRAADARPLRSERLPSVGTGALRPSVILPITAVAVSTRRPPGRSCDENPLGGFWPR